MGEACKRNDAEGDADRYSQGNQQQDGSEFSSVNDNGPMITLALSTA